MGSQEKSSKVKVEQDIIVLYKTIWSQKRCSHFPKDTASWESLNPHLLVSSSLALLCLQRLLGKTAGDFPPFIRPTLMQHLLRIRQLLEPRDRRMKSNSLCLAEAFFSDLHPGEPQMSTPSIRIPSGLQGLGVNRRRVALQRQAPPGPGGLPAQAPAPPAYPGSCGCRCHRTNHARKSS